MVDRNNTTDYSTGATRYLLGVEVMLLFVFCIALLGYVLAWAATEPLAGLSLSPVTNLQSLTTTLGWLAFLVVVPVYVLYRLRVDWSFTGTLMPGRVGLAAFATSSIIWVGTETLGVRGFWATAAALAALIVGLYKMVRQFQAVDESVIRDAVSELADQ